MVIFKRYILFIYRINLHQKRQIPQHPKYQIFDELIIILFRYLKFWVQKTLNMHTYFVKYVVNLNNKILMKADNNMYLQSTSYIIWCYIHPLVCLTSIFMCVEKLKFS